MKRNRSESGQTLVLVIFAIVGLFGFAALAVDGGIVFSERRRAQNAADSAALAMASAASRPDATASSPFTAAMKMLEKNGYGADIDPNENLGKTMDVQVFHPPISGPYKDVANKDEYYQVIIRQTVSKFFSQFVFSGDEKFTVESVTRFRGIHDLTGGKALFATGENVCPGIVFNGSQTTNISGGGIFSNSGGSDPHGGCTSGSSTGASGNISVTGGDIEMAGSWDQNANLTISPAPVPFTPHSTVLDQPPPDCTGLPTRNSNSATLQPGYYPNNISVSGDVTMLPGLYCLKGNLTANNGSLRGAGVVIYMMANGGGISFGGNALIDLRTGENVPDANGDNFTGYVIFMDKNNHNGVDLSGSNGSQYVGTIYAPGPRDPASKSKCNIGGNPTSVTLNSAIICSTIGISGSSSLTIVYDAKQNRQAAISLEQTQ